MSPGFSDTLRSKDRAVYPPVRGSSDRESVEPVESVAPQILCFS